MSTSLTHDVAIVGGGAAGLSAAVALARSLRSVVVVDAGEPRNAPAAGAHNVLAREGVSPLELLAAGRGEQNTTVRRSAMTVPSPHVVVMMASSWISHPARLSGHAGSCSRRG